MIAVVYVQKHGSTVVHINKQTQNYSSAKHLC